MAKAEISWKRTTAEGDPLQVYVQHVGREWRFFARERRHDQWQTIGEPPLEDWLELLDAIQRRIQRRLLRFRRHSTRLSRITPPSLHLVPCHLRQAKRLKSRSRKMEGRGSKAAFGPRAQR